MSLRIAECGLRNGRLALLTGLSLILTALWCATALAEIKIFEANSTYLMRDNDSKVDARRIAVQDAKRKVLELANAYVAGLEQIRKFQLSRDALRAYTAGILEADIVSEQTRGTTEHPEIYIKTRCKIDVDILTNRIDRYQENEDLKEELMASARGNEALKLERAALVKKLALRKNKTKTEETREKLDMVLAKEEANDETTKVWAGFALALEEDEGNDQTINASELDRSAAILERVVKVNPLNQMARHLLATIYRRNGDHEAAEEQLRTAIHNNPSNPAPHMKLGLLLKERGRYQEALTEFHFVERVRPRHLAVVFHAGMTFKDLEKCGKAVQYLNRFLKDKRAEKAPLKKERAIQAIKECGGNRPGRPKRFKPI